MRGALGRPRWRPKHSSIRPSPAISSWGASSVRTITTPLRKGGSSGSGQAAERHHEERAITSIPSARNRASAASSASRQSVHAPLSLQPSATMTAESRSGSPSISTAGRAVSDVAESLFMTPVPGERIALFIDGANLYSAARALNADLDFRKLLDLYRASGVLVRAYYYTAVVEGEEFSPLKPLVDWLDYNGFSVVTKPVKRFTDPEGRSRTKGNMDIEIAVDMLELAPRLDHAVLFSGDGDFRRLVQAVQAKGVRVTVVSTLKSQPPQIADELRRQADGFVELADLLPEVGRPRAGS